MRSEILKTIKRIVIKIGSRILTDEDGNLNRSWISAFAAEVAGLRRNGIEVIMVSSGAIAAGRTMLGISERPKTIPQKQAAAAVGQPHLMHEYEKAMQPLGCRVAQILLTRDDLADRQRFLNARATLDTLLEYGIIPIINENDTVAVEELKFGDNDNLSALVTNLTDAGVLLILTDIDGLYDADPRNNPEAKLIPLVEVGHKRDGAGRRREQFNSRYRRYGDKAVCGKEGRQIRGRDTDNQRNRPENHQQSVQRGRVWNPHSSRTKKFYEQKTLDRFYNPSPG